MAFILIKNVDKTEYVPNPSSSDRTQHKTNFFMPITIGSTGLLLMDRVFEMARETEVQSKGESYQKLKMWYLLLFGLTLSLIRYLSKVKWSISGKEIAPSSTPRCSSYWKRAFRVAHVYGCQIYFYFYLQLVWLRSFPVPLLVA